MLIWIGQFQSSFELWRALPGREMLGDGVLGVLEALEALGALLGVLGVLEARDPKGP